MSEETGLKTRTNEINAVFNIPKNMTEKDFVYKFSEMLDKLSANGYFYAGIVHNKDFAKDGTLKTYHIHCVFIARTRPRLNSFLYTCGDLLGYTTLDQLNTIQLQKINDLSAAIQYLTHKNNADKYQYDFNDIFTNLAKSTLCEYYKHYIQAEVVTTNQLVIYVLDGKSNIEIMQIIGVGRYSLYRKAIEDIRKDLSLYGFDKYIDLVQDINDTDNVAL